MADYIQTTTTRSAVRDLTVPMTGITTFDALVQDIIDTNPFGCTLYVEQGVTIDPFVRSQERYDAKIVYENLEADTIGDVSVQVATVAAFGTAAAHVMDDETLATAIGGTPSRNTAKDTNSRKLKCHDATGETYYTAIIQQSASSMQQWLNRSLAWRFAEMNDTFLLMLRYTGSGPQNQTSGLCLMSGMGVVTMTGIPVNLGVVMILMNGVMSQMKAVMTRIEGCDDRD